MSLEVPQVDREAGMLVYASQGGRLQGRIRASKQDFRVDEIFDVTLIEKEKKQGYVPVYSLTKSGLDTPHAAKGLADVLRSNVNFAGMKDSDAVTTQYVSARSTRAMDPETVQGRGFDAERVGYLQRPINRSMISGNAFRVVVRSESDLTPQVRAVFGLCASRQLPNFFGYQRFGLRGMVNQKVGKAVVLRDFREAVETLCGEPRWKEGEEASEARRLFRVGDYRNAQRLFSPLRQDIERRVSGHLAHASSDFFGAFRRIPIIPRRLLVQSYQSYLFNLTISRSLSAGLDISRATAGDNWAELNQDGLRVGRVHGVKETLPDTGELVPLVQLVGYAHRDYGSRFDAILRGVLEEEGVRPSSFYIKEAEEVSSEGGFRQAPLLARDLAHSTVEGGVSLAFSLGKGEYATTLLREVLKPEDPASSGF